MKREHTLLREAVVAAALRRVVADTWPAVMDAPHSPAAAEALAERLIDFLDNRGWVVVQRTAVVPRCRQCGEPRPAGCTVTCGRSECQQAEAAENKVRARARKRPVA